MVDKAKEYIRAITSILSELLKGISSGLETKKRFNYSLSYLALGSIFLWQQLLQVEESCTTFVTILLIVDVIMGGFLFAFALAVLGYAFRGTLIEDLINAILGMAFFIFELGTILLELIQVGIAKSFALIIKALNVDTNYAKLKK